MMLLCSILSIRYILTYSFIYSIISSNKCPAADSVATCQAAQYSKHVEQCIDFPLEHSIASSIDYCNNDPICCLLPHPLLEFHKIQAFLMLQGSICWLQNWWRFSLLHQLLQLVLHQYLICILLHSVPWNVSLIDPLKSYGSYTFHDISVSLPTVCPIHHSFLCHLQIHFFFYFPHYCHLYCYSKVETLPQYEEYLCRYDCNTTTVWRIPV